MKKNKKRVLILIFIFIVAIIISAVRFWPEKSLDIEKILDIEKKLYIENKKVNSPQVRILLPSEGRNVLMRQQNMDLKEGAMSNIDFTSDLNGTGHVYGRYTDRRFFADIEIGQFENYTYEKKYASTVEEQNEQIKQAIDDNVGIIEILAVDIEGIKDMLIKAREKGIFVIGLSLIEKLYADQYISISYDRIIYPNNCGDEKPYKTAYIITDDTKDYEIRVKKKFNETKDKGCKDVNKFIEYDPSTIKEEIKKAIKEEYPGIMVLDYAIATEFMEIYKTIEDTNYTDVHLGYLNENTMKPSDITYDEMYQWEKDYDYVRYYSAEKAALQVFSAEGAYNYILEDIGYFESVEYKRGLGGPAADSYEMMGKYKKEIYMFLNSFFYVDKKLQLHSREEQYDPPRFKELKAQDELQNAQQP